MSLTLLRALNAVWDHLGPPRRGLHVPMAEASFVLPPPDPLVVRPWGPDVAAAFVAAAGRARERMPAYSSLETALQRKQHKSHMAAFALVPKIPLQCIARSMSISEADLRPCGPDAVLFSVVGAMSRAPAASIDRARTSLARWTKFATTDGRLPLGPGIFSPLDVQAFLMQVHRDAAVRSKHPLQQGATAAPNVRQGLTFLTDFGFDFGLDTVYTELRKPKTMVKMRCERPTIRVIAHLEQAAAAPGYTPFVRGTAAGFVALAFSVSRLQQLQATDVDITLSGALEGICYRDKIPSWQKQMPRLVWIPSQGFFGDEWITALRVMLAGAGGRGQFVLRDTDSPSGDPFDATAWSTAPLEGGRAHKALHAILVRACALPQDAAARVSISSFRKFLPELARARGSSQSEVDELGRWAGSASATAARTSASYSASAIAAETIDRLQE